MRSVNPSDPRWLAGRLKRVSAVMAALAFGAFWGLAATHPVGVTASQSSAGTSSSLGSSGGVAAQTPAAAHGATRSSSTTTRVRGRISNGGSSAPVLNSGSS